MNGDVSARTAEYAAALLGEAELAGGLAFPVQVPRAQLDYSLGSLSSLQQYLERVRPFANSLDTQVYQNTLLAAGSYLGEVIRREVLPEADWAAPVSGGMPILQVAGGTLTPVAQIQLVLSGATGEDLPTYASNQFSFTGAASAGDAAAAEDEFGFDFLDELESGPAVAEAPEDLDPGVEAADVEDLWGDLDTTAEASAPADELSPGQPEETDDFAPWGEESSESATAAWSGPEASTESPVTGEEEEEFGFPWEEETKSASADFADLTEAIPEPTDEDEFGFTSESEETVAFAPGPLEAASDEAEPELEFGSTSEWDEDDDIIVDVEIVEEDEDETMAWPATEAQAFAAPVLPQEESLEDDGEIDLWAGAEPTEESEAAGAANIGDAGDGWMNFDAEASADDAAAEVENKVESEEEEAPLPFAPPILPQAEFDQFSFESASNDEQELPPLESEAQELAEFGEGEELGFDFESEPADESDQTMSAAPVAEEEELPSSSENFDAASLFGEEAVPLKEVVREEASLDEEFFGELTEEEMADDDSLLGFGASEMASDLSAEEGSENFEETAAFDPLVEPAETTQDWDPVAEEPIDAPAEAAEPTAETATPPVLPAGPAKPPEAWDFADFFAAPGAAAAAGANWFQEFDSSPAAELPTEKTTDVEDLEATADFGAEEVARNEDFSLDEFLPGEETEPTDFSDFAATDDFVEPAVEAAEPLAVEAADEFDSLLGGPAAEATEEEEAAPWPTQDLPTDEMAESSETSEFDFAAELEPASEMEDLLDFDQPDEISSLFGVPNEDSTEIEEGSPEFAALMGSDVEQASTEPEMEELLGEDFVAESAPEEDEFFPIAEAESESEPIADEAAKDLVAEPSAESSEPVDEWDFATPAAAVEGAAEAFDFDFGAEEAVPAEVSDVTANESPEEELVEEAAEFDLFADEELTPAEPEGVAAEESLSEPAEEAAEPVAEATADDKLDFGFETVEPAVEAADDAFNFDFEAKESADAETEFAAEEELQAEAETAFDFEVEPAAEAVSEATDALDLEEPVELTPAAEEASAAEFSFDEPVTEEFAAEEVVPEDLSTAETPAAESSDEGFDFEELLDTAAIAPLAGAGFAAALPEQEELAAEESAEEEFPVEEFANNEFAAEEVAEPAELPPCLAVQQTQLDQFLTAAAKGDAQAQFDLGRLYEEGLFSEDNFPEAVRRYQEAADQGHRGAMARLGHLYYLGQGVGQNWKKGVQLYLQAAKSGEPLAQCNLGMCLEHGKGATRDMEKSLRCYYAGANSGSAPCQTNLGLCYLRGRGVKQQLRVGARWLAKAAEQSYGPALLLLGACYEGGVGVEQSSSEAESLYRRAADAGYAFPKGSWKIRTKHGKATAQDAVDPLWWLRLAADANEPWAQHNMGMCYRSGHGVRESASKTLQWFQLAAKENFAPSQYELGRCYETATGVPKDMARAAKWYTRSATAGYAPAQARLALLYDCGLGVERDPALAAKWGEK